MHAVHAFIRGKVQGVYYRDSTRLEAERLGVRGWVQNLPDGRVELHAEGEAEAVHGLLAWCREGPRAAVVEDVAVQEVPPQGLQGFRVLR